MLKRILAMLLSLALICGSVPAQAMAAQETEGEHTHTEETIQTEETLESAEQVEETTAATEETDEPVETTAAEEETTAPSLPEQTGAVEEETTAPSQPEQDESGEISETEATESVPETEPEPEQPEEVLTLTVVPDVDLPDNDELFAGYAERLFYGGGFSFYGRSAGDRLTGNEKILYDAFVPILKEIADGKRESTIIDVGEAGTGKELDAVVEFTEDAFGQAELHRLVNALLADLPYELYWYDKVSGCAASMHGGSGLTRVTVFLTVAENYCAEDIYTVDTQKTGLASKAAANAGAIVSALAGVSDYNKLKGYRDEICRLVTYNYEAAGTVNFSEDNDPWQLIYVFDGDSSTNVVCEGYAKSFMYLCDMTSFWGDVACHTVTGYMNTEAHMWNVVRMDGCSYFADITNSDSLNGDPNMFLSGFSGSPDTGYRISGLWYSYDSNTKNFWGTDDDSILALESKSYDPSAYTGACGDGLIWEYDPASKALTIYGTGTMKDYNAKAAPWYRYAEDIETVSIGKGVASIGRNAFYGCEELEAVTLPETLEKIGASAFEGCEELENITVPAAVKKIDAKAFSGCEALETITFSGAAPTMGKDALKDVRATVVYPVGDTTWTEDVLKNCGGSVTLLAQSCVDGHGVKDWQQDKAPTCTQDGEESGICEKCGKQQIRVIALLGHSELVLDAVEPTCTQTGLTEGRSCARCGAVFVAQTTIPALGHSEIIQEAVAPTCTETGLTEGKYCGVCHVVLTEQTVIDALGHTEVFQQAVEPTCTETGLTEGSYCGVCETVFVQQQVIPAKGHSEVTDAAKEPDCVNPGLTQGSHCATCQEVLTEQTVIDALGHTETVLPGKVPTCTEAGLTEGVACEICETVLAEQEVIPATGHAHGAEVTVPTCTMPGYTTYTCLCGDSYVADHTDALGHDWDPGVVTSPSTPEQPGEITYTCQRCQTTRIQPQNLAIPEDLSGELYGGKSMMLKLLDPTSGKKLASSKVRWTMAEEYSPYATINKSGKLTARKVVEKTTVKVIGTMVSNPDVWIEHTVAIYPAVTQVEVWCAGDLVNGKTVPMDFTQESMTFRVDTYPLDTLEKVQWTISDSKKQAYAAYTVEGDTLTISNPKEKAGTVTIKATVDAGVKKTVTFKVQFASFAKTVEIRNTETQLRAGDKALTLKAEITDPDVVTKSGIVWSLKDSADKAYVNLTSGGKLTAKTVYGEHDVTIVATSKDGKASDDFTIKILPKKDDILVIRDENQKNITKSTVYVDLNSEDTAVTLTAENLKGGETGIITWSPAKTSKSAEVDIDGNAITVKMLKAGSLTVTAKTADKRSATVTIKASKLADKVQITSEKGFEVASGKSLTLKATVEKASSSKVVWSIVSGDAYAKISSSGKLTAAKDLTSVREVLVRATAADGSGEKAEQKIIIRPLAQGVQIYQSGSQVRSNTVLVWDMTTLPRIQLNAKVYPMIAAQSVQLTSSNKKVADFDENQDLVCFNTGTTTITAKALDGSNQKITFKLTVVKRVTSLTLKEGLKLDAAGNLYVKGGKSLKLSSMVVVGPKDATNKKLNWRVSKNSAGITITSGGQLNTKKVTAPVTVNVMVTAQDGSGEMLSFHVTVNPK